MKTIQMGQLDLALAHWAFNGTGTPRAIVQLVHGISEHIGRYDEFAQFLNDNGFEVYGHDHPGHGQTGPILGECPGDAMSTLTAGIRAVREVIAQEHPERPVVLFGHSMGSFLSLRSCELDKESWDALILCGTNGRNSWTTERIALTGGRFFCWRDADKEHRVRLNQLLFMDMNRAIPSPRTPFDWLNRVDQEVDRYLMDPLCGHPMKDEFLYSLIKGLSVWYRKEELARLSKNLPILILSGTMDPVGQHGRGAAKLARSLTESGVRQVYLRFYEGARHELLLEESRYEMMNDILDFLNLVLKE
ncbi:putative lysophospholipase or monoglyceride lipase [Clostridiaceae bacterium JG1575]|nr:putative lysophospholipase or monoglyceride lipase [Clostridiaceae bacterium JG1575]